MKISDTKLRCKFAAKRKNAASRNIEFNLTYDDLRTLFERNAGYCDYTGLEFNTSRVPTIERIDDKKGYVVGNLCLTCQEANQMKDSLIDKTSVTRFRVRKDGLAILDSLRTKVTPDYLEHLKHKYRTDTHYNPSTDLYKDHFKNVTEQLTKEDVSTIVTESNKHKFISGEIMSKNTTQNTTEIVNEMPQDVYLASYYANLAKASKSTGMKFTITYAEFKAKFTAKTCRFSGKKLQTEDKFLLVMDKHKSFSSDNVILVDNQLGHSIMEFSEKAGLSVDQLKKMFKRMA